MSKIIPYIGKSYQNRGLVGSCSVSSERKPILQKEYFNGYDFPIGYAQNVVGNWRQNFLSRDGDKNGNSGKPAKESKHSKSLKNIGEALREISFKVSGQLIQRAEISNGSNKNSNIFKKESFKDAQSKINERNDNLISGSRTTCPNFFTKNQFSIFAETPAEKNKEGKKLNNLKNISTFNPQKNMAESRSERNSYESKNFRRISPPPIQSQYNISLNIPKSRKKEPMKDSLMNKLEQIKKELEVKEKQKEKEKEKQEEKISKMRAQTNLKNEILVEVSTAENSTMSEDMMNMMNQTLSRSRICKNAVKKSTELNNFSMKDFRLLKTLGEGKFGNVFLAQHKKTGVLIALKKISKEKVKKFNMMRQIVDEIKINFSFSHPNIVKLFGIFQEKEDIYLILEYVMGGSLFDYLNERGELSLEETLTFLEGILAGLEEMHRKSIAHRDLKPENILIAGPGMVKICDMGWAALITSSRKTYCGTFDYVAPQILERKNYDLSVDIWCLGAMTYELLLGRMPYEGDQRTIICKKISNAQVRFPSSLLPEARDFILWLVNKNPESRPKCREILLHPVFSLRKK